LVHLLRKCFGKVKGFGLERFFEMQIVFGTTMESNFGLNGVWKNDSLQRTFDFFF